MSKARPVRLPAPVPRRRLITLTCAAEQAKVSVQTIRSYISTGLLTGYRLGPRVLRVDQDDVDRLVREIPTWRRNMAAALRAADVAVVSAEAAEAELDLLSRVRP